MLYEIVNSRGEKIFLSTIIIIISKLDFQILGLGVDQLIGRVWWQLAHPADEQLLQEAFVALLRSFFFHY